MKRVAKTRIATIKTRGIMILLVLLLATVNFIFIGNPIGSFIARARIEAYVTKHFNGFNFVVGFPRFNLQHDNYYYTAIVHARNNANKYFEVIYFSRIGSVDFTYNFGHFRDRYSNVLRYLISPLIENEFGYNFEGIWVSQSSSSLTPEYHLNIELKADCLDPYRLLGLIIRCRDIINQNDMPIKFFSFRFVSSDKEMRINHLQREHINENLLSVIESMQYSVGTSGNKDIGGFPPIFFKYENIS